MKRFYCTFFTILLLFLSIFKSPPAHIYGASTNNEPVLMAPSAILMEAETGTILYQKKENDIRCVNMLGCHDGIPLLDLKGLVPDDRIQGLIDLIVSRGGLIKNLHGKKNMYYQVNATYFSALGCDEKKLLLARALQLFMPGKPQVWYLDLFAGKNDCEAVRRSGEAGHKEINRTNLPKAEIEKRLQWPIVQKQLELLKWRNSCQAFGFEADLQIEQPQNHVLRLIWSNHD